MTVSQKKIHLISQKKLEEQEQKTFFLQEKLNKVEEELTTLRERARERESVTNQSVKSQQSSKIIISQIVTKSAACVIM